MTPQEQQMLQGLTDRINQTVLQEKDPDAEQFIQQALGRNPDATYILAQTVLVQQYALDQAKKQLDDAKQQLAQQAQQPKHSGSFLGSLLGTNDDRQAPPPPPPPQYAPVNNPPAYGQPQYGQPQNMLRRSTGSRNMGSRSMGSRRGAVFCVQRCRPRPASQRVRWHLRASNR